MNWKRIILGIIVLIVFGTIFIFSSENGEKSQSVSENFTMRIINILPQTKKLSQNTKNRIVKKSQFIVRKTAHFTIYLCAGLSVAGYINTFKKLTLKNKILVSLLICVLYAVSDEIHQFFSGGRTPRVFDVFIDSLGSTFGIMIIYGKMIYINNKN